MLSGPRSRSGRETLQKPQADVKVTFGWFVRNRWLPLKEANWKEETARDKKCIIQMDLIGKFDNVPLENFDKFSLQVHLNDLAKTRSRDRVLQIRAYMRDIFAEAVDQDFLPKDPARKVEVPKQLADTDTTILSWDQLRNVLTKLALKDRLILELDMTVALRPSELFGLRWRDFNYDECLLELHGLCIGESCAIGERLARRCALCTSRKNWQMISGCGSRNPNARSLTTSFSQIG